MEIKHYPCPVCKAAPGEPCVSPYTGEQYTTLHDSRNPAWHRGWIKQATADSRALQWLTNSIVRGNGF